MIITSTSNKECVGDTETHRDTQRHTETETESENEYEKSLS